MHPCASDEKEEGELSKEDFDFVVNPTDTDYYIDSPNKPANGTDADRAASAV